MESDGRHLEALQKPLRTLHLPSSAVMLFLGCFVDDKWQSRLRILSNYTVLCGFREI